ncbi:MAG: diacylglycerol/lipid kinase family protein [Candidatus Sericytochromatia bacterium]
MKTPRVRATLIYNPTAGQIWGAFKPEGVISYLAKHDWQVEATPTAYAGHGSELARQAVRDGYDVVLAAGGDGTLNEVVQGLAHSSVTLGVLPVGTTNVLARELQIPLNFQEALECLPLAEPFTLDLGRMNRRYFILMAGIGYDAEVMRDVNPHIKLFAGKMAVVTSSVLNLFNHQSFVVRLNFIDAAGKRHRLGRSVMQIFVSNAATYATDYKIAEQARLDDGLLELHIFKSRRFRDTLSSLLSLALRRHKEWIEFEHYRIRSLQIKARKAVPVQLDGDTVGKTPLLIEVVPQALRVLRPRQVLS